MQRIFKFEPVFMERPWGGRRIDGYSPIHRLPGGNPIGESWELVDREETCSVIRNGEWKGRTLRDLLKERGAEILGRPWTPERRFPLLIKILDAAERLSLQVHPPASVAAELGGESKTEMWYFLETHPEAAILMGLKKGSTRNAFEMALSQGGELERLVHRVQVQQGDAAFLPSGRIHAIDAGCLILEIQENSDTTYRVYDWGRVGLDGKPRKLHVEESLKCIDFEDSEPAILSAGQIDSLAGAPFVDCPLFKTTKFTNRDLECASRQDSPRVIHVLDGSLMIESRGDGTTVEEVSKGETVLLSAGRHGFRNGGTSSEAEWISVTF
jgi:mannose-6-phosphate isomerase